MVKPQLDLAPKYINEVRCMKNNVITRIKEDNPVIEWEVHSNSSLAYKKHMQALSAARELISRADTYDITIYDSLNCGKMARLIDYIKNGSAFILLWVSYNQHIVSLA
ncbi:MAG: hypothetical protein K0R55_1348 [Sporomusa sp.]|jgi:hypothetical protein|nr:hypothetical protein [Sporomusa sp.]